MNGTPPGRHGCCATSHGHKCPGPLTGSTIATRPWPSFPPSYQRFQQRPTTRPSRRFGQHDPRPAPRQPPARDVAAQTSVITWHLFADAVPKYTPPDFKVIPAGAEEELADDDDIPTDCISDIREMISDISSLVLYIFSLYFN